MELNLIYLSAPAENAVASQRVASAGVSGIPLLFYD
jgi:hypothetical protein